MPRTADRNQQDLDASDDGVTDDDMSPETLIDEDRSQESDESLPQASESNVGLGHGLDEAELADRDPVGREEARRLKQTIRQHAHDPNAVEPAEAEELAQRRAQAQPKQ